MTLLRLLTHIKGAIGAMCLVLISAVTMNHVQSFSPMPAIRARAGTTNLFLASAERSCVELTDPKTGCRVVLVGCFHGSPSSARDVAREIETDPTDVVALELCASRYDDLRKIMTTTTTTLERETTKDDLPRWIVRFGQVVAATIQRQGLSTGIATGILGGVSGLQTALSGFTPGLEFITAVKTSREQYDCDIILADQCVDETIEKVGQLPRVVHSMWEELRTSHDLSSTQWVQMAAALRTALVGDPDVGPDHQIQVGSVVTRNRASILEMARLMVPPVVLTQTALTLTNQVVFPEQPVLNTQDGWMPLILCNPFVEFNPTALVLDAIPHVAILGAMLTCAYSLLAVPVTQVILAERDDQLTRGIRAACRVASSKHNHPDKDPGRVVAVLGLLHVNGVAKRLLSANLESQEWMALKRTRNALET